MVATLLRGILVCTIDHIQRKRRKQTLGNRIHTTFRKQKHRHSTRPQQAKPKKISKLQPRTPSILIFHLPPAEVLLSSVARLGALELSQTSRLVPSPWRIPPEGCRKSGGSTYPKRSDETSTTGRSCWISEDLRRQVPDV
jgi:hypothetical protein